MDSWCYPYSPDRLTMRTCEVHKVQTCYRPLFRWANVHFSLDNGLLGSDSHPAVSYPMLTVIPGLHPRADGMPFCLVPTHFPQARPTELKSSPTATELQAVYVRSMVDIRTPTSYRFSRLLLVLCRIRLTLRGHSTPRYVVVARLALRFLHCITQLRFCQALFSVACF